MIIIIMTISFLYGLINNIIFANLVIIKIFNFFFEIYIVSRLLSIQKIPAEL